jgi:acyl transferase domain-containing protein
MDSYDQCLASFGATFSVIGKLQKSKEEFKSCTNKLSTTELNEDAKTSAVNQAHVGQPACTAIQIALTDLLSSWGVSPSAVAGHSSGEIAAAYAAGILPLDSCMAISYQRGMAIVDLKK